MSRLGSIPGQPTAHPPFAQPPVASSPRPFPVTVAKAAANPGVELLEAGAVLTVTKVLPPPKQVGTKFLGELADAPTTGASRDLSDLLLEPLLCRFTDKEPEAAAAEAKTEKLSLPWPSDSTLGFIYFELEFGGEVAGYAPCGFVSDRMRSLATTGPLVFPWQRATPSLSR